MRPFRKVILAGMFTLWSLAWDIGNPWLTAAFTVAGILIGVLLYRKRKRSNPAEKAAPGKLPHPIPFGEKPETQFHPIRAERLERELAGFAIELFSYRKLSDSLLVGCLIVPAGLLSLFFMEQLLRSKNGLPFLTAAGTVWTVFALLTALSERSRERRQERLLRVAAEEGTRLAAADHRPPFSSDREEDLIRFCRCFGSEAEARTACEFAKQAGFRFLALPQDSLLLAAGESGFRKYVELCEALGFESSDFSPSIGEAVLYLNNHRRIAERRTPVPEELPPAESRPAPPPSAAVRKLRELARSGNVSNVSTVYEEESVRRPLFSEALFCGCWPSREEAAIAMVIRDTAAEVTCRGHSMMCYPEDPVALLVNGEFDSMDDVEFILTLELRFSASDSGLRRGEAAERHTRRTRRGDPPSAIDFTTSKGDNIMLDKLIGSKSRAEILKRLFTPEKPSIYLRRLAREAGFSAPVVHRELRTLLELGLVRQNSDGNRINFSANGGHPFFQPLCELVALDRINGNGEEK